MFFKNKNQKDIPVPEASSEQLKNFLPLTLDLADISKEIYLSSKELTNCSGTLTHISNDVESNIHINQDMIHKVSTEVDAINTAAENINVNAKRCEHLSSANMQNVEFSMNSLQESIHKIEDIFQYFDEVETIIAKLQNYSDSISNITCYIDQIASKTSLVSLNASIEAARAGEAGRGFMVITDEIKNLANQSKEFSNNINGMISDMTECINQLNQLSKANCEKITHTKQSVSILEGNLENISKSTSELDTNIQATLTSSHEIKNSVESGRHTVAELMTSFDETLTQSNAMTEAVKNQNQVADRLLSANDKVKVISEKQLNAVLDSRMEQKLIIIGQKTAHYEGPRDCAALRAYAKQHLLHSINYINNQGCFEAAANENAIGFNIFNAEPVYKDFKLSSDSIRVYPLSRNLFTGDIIRYVAAKHARTNQLISMGFNLDTLTKISEMTMEEIENL